MSRTRAETETETVSRTMHHLTDDELVLYRYDEAVDAATVEAHLAACARCRTELETLGRVLAEVDRDATPVRDASYGVSVWNAIEARLEPAPDNQSALWPRSWGGWVRWTVPQAALAGAVVAALLVAFGVPGPARPAPAAQDAVLVGAVEDHLERTGLMLVELNNAEATTVPQMRAWAEDLASANRLYRQSATLAGDERLGRLLDDLERVLLEVAHAPDDEPGTSELESLRGRLDTREVAFKVRVASAELRRRELVGQRAGLGTGGGADVGL